MSFPSRLVFGLLFLFGFFFFFPQSASVYAVECEYYIYLSSDETMPVTPVCVPPGDPLPAPPPNMIIQKVSTGQTSCVLNPGVTEWTFVGSDALQVCQDNLGTSYSPTCCTTGGGCTVQDNGSGGIGINLWDYNYATGCRAIFDPEQKTCSYKYSFKTDTCAAVDVCSASGGPYLNPRQCQTAGGCVIGGTTYKTCCYSSGQTDGACQLSMDPSGYPTGECPSGSGLATVMCGVDQATCDAVQAQGYKCTTQPCGTSACQAAFPQPPSFSLDLKANNNDCQGTGCGVNNGSAITYRVTITNSGGPGQATV